MIISSWSVCFRDFVLPRVMDVWELVTYIVCLRLIDNEQKQPLKCSVEELEHIGCILSTV